LVSYGRKGINAKFVVDNGLVNRVSYYKTIFDWTRIYGYVRLQYQRTIRQRLNKNGKGTPGFRRDEEAASLSSLQDLLPEINQLFKGSGLPEIVASTKEQSENLHGILRSIFMQTLFWRDSYKLRKELKRFLEVAP
jgi:hypothetical protein